MHECIGIASAYLDTGPMMNLSKLCNGQTFSNLFLSSWSSLSQEWPISTQLSKHYNPLNNRPIAEPQLSSVSTV